MDSLNTEYSNEKSPDNLSYDSNNFHIKLAIYVHVYYRDKLYIPVIKYMCAVLSHNAFFHMKQFWSYTCINKTGFIVRTK